MTEDFFAYIDALTATVEEVGEDPHASLLLTNGRHEDAVNLAYVLAHPKQLTLLDLSQRVRSQAERMWRRFGRDIDVNVDVQPDGFIEIRGDLRHAGAYIGEIIP